MSGEYESSGIHAARAVCYDPPPPAGRVTCSIPQKRREFNDIVGQRGMMGFVYSWERLLYPLLLQGGSPVAEITNM